MISSAAVVFISACDAAKHCKKCTYDEDADDDHKCTECENGGTVKDDGTCYGNCRYHYIHFSQPSAGYCQFGGLAGWLVGAKSCLSRVSLSFRAIQYRVVQKVITRSKFCDNFRKYRPILIIFTVRRSLHGICYSNSVRPSVRLSVCLSHSWTVSTWFDLRS